MEEKKLQEVPVWTEEQWESWLYSFATEIENGKIKTSVPAGDIQ